MRRRMSSGIGRVVRHGNPVLPLGPGKVQQPVRVEEFEPALTLRPMQHADAPFFRIHPRHTDGMRLGPRRWPAGMPVARGRGDRQRPDKSIRPFAVLLRAFGKKGSGTVVRSTLWAVPATVPDPFFPNALTLFPSHMDIESQPSVQGRASRAAGPRPIENPFGNGEILRWQSQDLVDDPPMDVGQAEVAAAEADRSAARDPCRAGAGSSRADRGSCRHCRRRACPARRSRRRRRRP